ncbi:TonB C-terminal domain-containing protein [Acinetobacter stercoris]|uniref:Gram-negative bacterial tonB protein n=1 Tax=Acinetobacter stercoris TaxID=2126983 RepID=A0A2U3MV10_9GAMM|nr:MULTISPECIES: TonB C-terminal domain-containing protein [Acinetobacter]SPL69261.1 Gram-negative bacterial tonB protein [Acinetobacter stercoris]
MKQSICLALLVSLPISAVLAANHDKPLKLTTQKISAEPAHLTTRLQWTKYPHPVYKIADLQDRDRVAIIRVYANEEGKITKAEVKETTGLGNLDQKLVDAVLAARIKPYKKNGIALSTIGYQTFTLKVDEAEDDLSQKNKCTYHFDSKNWLKQHADKSVPFTYVNQPELNIDKDELKYADRTVKFKFKVDKNGEIKHVKLTKRSGINEIDQKVVTAVEQSQVGVKRTYKTLWIYKKSTLSDQITFKINECN